MSEAFKANVERNKNESQIFDSIGHFKDQEFLYKSGIWTRRAIQLLRKLSNDQSWDALKSLRRWRQNQYRKLEVLKMYLIDQYLIPLKEIRSF